MAGESLTKLIVNNKIVEMRKNVRQSRVHCINKLSKEIRKLKNKKGSDEQIAKNLRKVDKLIEQMAVIKKVNPDIVSKFSLQNEKSLAEITNDVNETTENKALSRLACHKSVYQKVLEFREKYPDWKKSLILLLESLGEKYKNKKQNKPVVSKKNEKKINSARKNATSAVDKENLNVPNTFQTAQIKSSSGLWTIENCETENTDSNHVTDYLSTSVPNSDEFADENSIAEKEKIVEKIAKLSNSKSKVKKLQFPDRNVEAEPFIEKISKENVIKTEPHLASEEIANVSNSKSKLKRLRFPETNVETEPSIEKISEENVKKKKSYLPLSKNIGSNKNLDNISNPNVPEIAADPFFVTKDNKEYLSVSARQILDREESAVNYYETERMKPQLKTEQFHSKHNQFKPRSKQNNGKFSKSTLAKRKNCDSPGQKPGNAKDVSAPTSLHPSWEAKKKLTTIIQNSQFQGKKIKFDD